MIMKNIPLAAVLILTMCFCGGKQDRKRAKAPVPASPNELVTGCYYITEDSTHMKRSVRNKTDETYFVDPKPIFHVGNFKEVTISREPAYSIYISLDIDGRLAFAKASEKYVGKKLAFIINDILVMAPRVTAKVDGGELQITGDFDEEEIENYYLQIDKEMYE